MPLEALRKIALPADTAAGVGRRGELTLRRAWPRANDHLLLEYTDEDGRPTPGQWMRDAAVLHRVEMETAARGGGLTTVLPIATGALCLQTNGADRRLKGLAKILTAAHTTLVSHRPERRAVVRRDVDGDVRFGKIFRRSRLAAQVRTHERVVRLDGRPFNVPEIAEVDEARGVVWFRALAGRCLDAEPACREVAHAVGITLRWMHDAPVPEDAPVHDAQAEARLLSTRLEWLDAFAPVTAALAREAAPAILDRLGRASSPTGLLHRDFYDKQLFVEDGARIGLLDFDTVAAGERALDVANMLAHLELRTLQGRMDEVSAAAVSRAFMEGYAPGAAVRERIPAYVDAARLRLACVYAYRPGQASVPPALLARLGV